MTDRKIKIWTGILSLLLLVSLLIKLCYVPGGMILSGLFLGGMMIVGILIGCLIVAGLLSLIFKSNSFQTLYFITVGICLLVFHYNLYSPTLKIIVPNNFTGRVTLVLSNVKDNILTVDTNGIGYLNEWSFNKTYTEPIVLETDGNKINERCVGFNPSTFWALGTSTLNNKELKTLSFEIVPENKKGQKQHYYKDITALVDQKLVLLQELDEHTTIQTEATIPEKDTTNNQ